MPKFLICRQCGGHDIRAGWLARHTLELVCADCGGTGTLTGCTVGEGDSLGEAYAALMLPAKGAGVC